MCLLFLLIAVLIMTTNYTISDGDTFFHIKVGEYISKYGFPSRDPFSMHDLNYTPHEWLSDFIFHKIYSSFGFLGLSVFLCIMMCVLILVLYKTNNLLNSNSSHLSFILTFGSIYVLNLFKFIVVRPHIFSFIIFVLEIYLIEAYIKSKRKLFWALIPILSLILANLHIGTLPMFFILFLPYLADNIIKLEKGKLNSQGNKSDFKLLFLTFLLSITSAFINPYGLKKIFYFTILFDSNTQTVYEWQSPSFKGAQGILIFSTFIIGLMIMIFSKSKISLKNILMYFGLMFMSLYSIRYYSYFMLLTGPILGNILSNNSTIKSYELPIAKLKNNTLSIIVPIALVLFSLIFKFTYNFKALNLDKFPVDSVRYLKENTDYQNIRIFNDYTYGGYILLNDVKVFIDSRQDLYLKAYNNNCTVYSDYLDVINGKVNYKNIFNKYSFEYLIISKNSLLETYVSSDSEYEKLLSDKDCVLYKRK